MYTVRKGKKEDLPAILDLITELALYEKAPGKLLFERVLAKSLEDGCTGMMWQVLDWNEPAINFYKKYGASMEEEWINCNLQSEEIRALI